MKNLGIFLFVLGLVLIIGSLFYYKQAYNAVDTGGSMVITTTPGGAWTVKIPMYAGGIMLFLGSLIYYVAVQKNQNPTADQTV